MNPRMHYAGLWYEGPRVQLPNGKEYQVRFADLTRRERRSWTARCVLPVKPRVTAFNYYEDPAQRNAARALRAQPRRPYAPELRPTNTDRRRAQRTKWYMLKLEKPYLPRANARRLLGVL